MNDMRNVLLVFSGLLLTSCHGLKVNYSSSEPRMQESRALTGFECIEQLGSLDVKYQQADTFSVIVEGSVETCKEVETRVDGNRLIVNMKDANKTIHFGVFGVNDGSDVTVYVTSPDFLGIELKGSGDFKCVHHLDTDNLDIRLNGSGDITFDDVICDRAKVSLLGSGDVKVKHIEALQSDVELVGSGDISMNFTRSGAVSSTLVGSGDITLRGDVAKYQSNVRGSGDVNTSGLVIGK